MSRSNIKKLIVLQILLLLIMFGCTNNQTLDSSPNEQLNIQYISHTNEKEHQINQSVNQYFDEVVDLSSITYNNEMIMAIKVDQLSQFNEQKIAKEVESYIKDSYPKIKAKVSSDYKIFLEINRLKDKITNQDLAKTDFNKEFKQIKELTKTPKE